MGWTVLEIDLSEGAIGSSSFYRQKPHRATRLSMSFSQYRSLRIGFDHALVPSQGIEPQSQDSESCVLPLNELGMVLAPGIEPRLTESKSAVLPLDEARVLVPGPRVERDSTAFQTVATTALAHRGLLLKLDVPVNVRLVVRPFRPQRVDVQPEIEPWVELIRLDRLLPES